MVTFLLIVAAVLLVAGLVGAGAYCFGSGSLFDFMLSIQLANVLGDLLGAVVQAIFDRN